MKKKSTGDRILDITIYTALILLALITIFPFLNMLALSLNEAGDSLKGGITIFPRKYTFANYQAVFDGANISRSYGVTIFRTITGIILSLIFNSITAYTLSKKYIKIRRPMLLFLVITTLFGGGMIPYYITLKNLHLLNSILVYILPSIYNVFYILIFRTFFEGLPASLEESAKIDGANDITIMLKVIVPISMPVFAAIALFTGVAHWNDWFTGEFYVTASKLQTLQNYLLKVLQENAAATSIDSYRNASSAHSVKVSPESVRMAVLMTVCLPIMCIYPFLQKYFVKGVLIGAVKG